MHYYLLTYLRTYNLNDYVSVLMPRESNFKSSSYIQQFTRHFKKLYLVFLQYFVGCEPVSEIFGRSIPQEFGTNHSFCPASICVLLLYLAKQAASGARNFHLGTIAQRVWETQFQVWETQSPEAKAVRGHCLQILTAETIKIWKFRTIHLLILDQYV